MRSTRVLEARLTYFPRKWPQPRVVPQSRLSRGGRLLPTRKSRRRVARHGHRRTPARRRDRMIRRRDAEHMKLAYWAGGFAAAVTAGLVMWLLRMSVQVRSIPERVLEWLLLFVPLDLF